MLLTIPFCECTLIHSTSLLLLEFPASLSLLCECFLLENSEVPGGGWGTQELEVRGPRELEFWGIVNIGELWGFPSQGIGDLR